MQLKILPRNITPLNLISDHRGKMYQQETLILPARTVQKYFLPTMKLLVLPHVKVTKTNASPKPPSVVREQYSLAIKHQRVCYRVHKNHLPSACVKQETHCSLHQWKALIKAASQFMHRDQGKRQLYPFSLFLGCS